MSTFPSQGRMAVFDQPNGEFRLIERPLRSVRHDEALVQVRMSTICRSDIHSYLGHRPSPCPGLLGHEIVGTLVALGKSLTHDMCGEPLSVGDRVTWSEYFIEPGSYVGDVLNLPQKRSGPVHLNNFSPFYK